MNFVTVLEDNRYPLELLELKYDGPKLAQLCEEIGEGRGRRFQRIVVSGGLALKTGWTGKIRVIKAFDLHRSKITGAAMVLGFFQPRTGEIKLYPEGILEIIVRKAVGRPVLGRIAHQREIIDKFHQQFYETLIEEIEHGYQEPTKKQYRSFWSKLVAFTSPAMPLYLILTTSYVILFEHSRWWLVAVFFGLLFWIFLPVLVSLIPTPRWYQRLRYKFNPRENDAKGKAQSIRLIRQSREAIWFELGLGRS